SLTITYTVTLTDDNGTTTTQDITVTINGTNDVPVIAAATAVSETLTDGDSALTAAGSFEVLDVDTSDEISISGIDVETTADDSDTSVPEKSALLDMLTGLSVDDIIVDGTANQGTVNWQFDAAAGVFDYLALEESITLTYTVTLTDDNGATTTQDITVTINGTNDVPVVVSAIDVEETLIEDGIAALSTFGSFDVADADVTDVVSITDLSVSIDSNNTDSFSLDNATLLALLGLTPGDIISNSENEGTVDWTFDADASAFDFLADGEFIELTYTVTVADDNVPPTSITQDIVITIEGTESSSTIGDEFDNVLQGTNSSDVFTGNEGSDEFVIVGDIEDFQMDTISDYTNEFYEDESELGYFEEKDVINLDAIFEQYAAEDENFSVEDFLELITFLESDTNGTEVIFQIDGVNIVELENINLGDYVWISVAGTETDVQMIGAAS
ncbi:MAG: VCBS domain-containing protein, partial [Salaquimonas sp.]